MKKRLAAAILSFTTVLALSGCYPTGEKNLSSDNPVASSDNQENSSEAQSVVGKVSEKIGEVEFNYEISADFPTKAPKIKLKPKQLDSELVKNLLLRDKTVISENGALYKTEDKCTRLLGSNDFIFTDSSVGDTLKNFGTIANVYDDFCRSSSKQLKSFSSQNAVERVNKILDEIGIENYGEPHIIPISPEEGNAYLEEHGGFQKLKDSNPAEGQNNYTPWEEDDGVYILKYVFEYNGIDLTSGELKMPNAGRTIQGAEITAYVTKDSVFYLDVSALYDIVSLNEETIDLKYDAGYASNALIEHYSKMTDDIGPRFFTECKLEYVPMEYAESDEIIFAPAWCFMGYRLVGYNDDIPDDFAEYLYAETRIRYGSF